MRRRPSFVVIEWKPLAIEQAFLVLRGGGLGRNGQMVQTSREVVGAVPRSNPQNFHYSIDYIRAHCLPVNWYIQNFRDHVTHFIHILSMRLLKIISHS